MDNNGNVYIIEASFAKIRVVNSAGIISTFAGTGAFGTTGDGGPANLALLLNPQGVAADTSGNVYIADYNVNNGRIRKVSSAGIITTFAGTGTSGDGGPATSAYLYAAQGVSADISGNVYIIDNNRIHKVDNTGIITIIAGTGTGSSGDGGPGTSAQLNNPKGLSADISGNVFIADSSNNKIRMINSAGIITTIAGTGTGGSNGDGGLATVAQLNNPYGVSVDSNGNVFIADFISNKIRLIFQPQPSAIPTATPSTSPTNQPTTQVN